MEEFHLVTDVADLKRIIDSLKSEIVVLNDQYEEKKSILREKLSLQGKSQIVRNNDSISLDVLLDKQKFLEAQVQVLKDRKLRDVIQDPSICELIAETELNQLSRAYREMITETEEDIAHLETVSKKLDVVIETDTRIVEALRDKVAISQEEAAKTAAARQEKYIADLKTKIRDAKKSVTKISKEMTTFFHKYYPNVPTNDDDVALIDEGRKENVPSYYHLSDIIERLVNAYMESPHRCYIEVDDQWWPPYLQMLLRHQIVIRHPQQLNKVRLEAYGSE